MIKYINLVAVALFSFFIGGCATYYPGRYSTMPDNVLKLRDIGNAKVMVGQFDSLTKDNNEILCRGLYPIKPGDASYADYLKKALIYELKTARLYSERSDAKISGRIDKLEFSSVKGSWLMTATFFSSDGDNDSISEEYSFPVSLWSDEHTCAQGAQAFMPLVQNVLSKYFDSAHFSRIAKKGQD